MRNMTRRLRDAEDVYRVFQLLHDDESVEYSDSVLAADRLERLETELYNAMAKGLYYTEREIRDLAQCVVSPLVTNGGRF